MYVEILAMPQFSAITGIGRYMDIPLNHLSVQVNVQRVSPKTLPLSDRFTFLKSLPIGIQGHRMGSIVHFPQIMGCALMLWKPYHPSVATVHDLGSLVLPEEKKLLDPIARRILNLSLAGMKRVDLILADSEYTRQTVIEKLGIPTDRVVKNYNAIDKDVFLPIPNARQRLEQIYPFLVHERGPWLLYVGSELPRKNLTVLFNAIAKLRKLFPHICLLKIGYAGGRVYRDATLQMIDVFGIKDSVLFFEDVPDTTLSLFYSSADILVHPSKLEGFGFPVLEAMTCGTPVVCSNATSLPEIAGGAAKLVPPDQVDVWVATIGEVLDNPGLSRELSENGLARAAHFSLGNTSLCLADAYQSII